jgi:hypothetical protein
MLQQSCPHSLLLDLIGTQADEKNATPPQMALAWVLKRNPQIVPISTYLAFIVKKPLHPPGMVMSGGRPIVNKHGKYFCPLKKRQLHEPLSLCQYCVSRESGAIGNE